MIDTTHAQSLFGAVPLALVVGLLTWPASELAAIAGSMLALVAAHRVGVHLIGKV